MTGIGFTRVKTKCLDCGLHFIVCTWHPEKHSHETLYCPECGQHEGNYLIWRENVGGMISDDVPGNTELEGGIPGILHLQRPKRINIYLDVDGVLLANDKQPALFADEFIEFLLRHHDVYWLTTHCRNLNDDPVRNVLEPHFKRETVDLLHQIKPTQWDTYKTEAIDFSRPFLWYDDQLFDEEKVQLKEHGVLDSWVEVDLATRPNSLLEFIIQPSS